MRSRGGRGGSREHSVPTTASPPASKVRHPNQFLPDRSKSILWMLNSGDTRPKISLQAAET
eukprot:1136833-Pelagomonas_calceolata.AAC.3